MTTYKLTLQTLTPIHIGDGDELRLGFDFAIHEGKTWRLDEDTILETKWHAMGLDRPGQRHYPLPGQVLTSADFQNPAFFRYVLRGTPRSQRNDARLKGYIKDPWDKPYIPGSSLKGAVRTALAWAGWKEGRLEIHDIREMQYYNRREDRWKAKNRPADRYERQIFEPANQHQNPDRRNPNHDLLRALQVSDLHGNLNPNTALAVVNAQVLTRHSLQSPIELEALLPNHTLTGTLKIDETLFTPQAERILHFDHRKRWLEELMQRVQAHSRARIARLAEWFAQAEGAEKVANFYHQLTGLHLGNNQALVQIGWGSGWDGKTFWTHLQANERLFEKLMRDFRLQHRRNRNAPPTRAKDFPVSRRVITTGSKDAPRIAAPFGWAVITMETLK